MNNKKNDIPTNNDGQTLYTLLVYSENIAGVLNQVTAVFTHQTGKYRKP